MRRLATILLLGACATDASSSSDSTSDESGAGPSTTTTASSSSDGSSATTIGTTDAEGSTSDGGDTTTAPSDDTASSDDGTTGWTPPADCSNGGALADLAETITVGEFVRLDTTGLDSALIDAGGGHHVLQYSDKGVWDPNTCQALFTGGGHLTLVKFLGYSASENTWFQAPNPTWWCETTSEDPYACSTHAYGHNALNPATGDYWFRTFNNPAVHHTVAASPVSAQWDEAPVLPSTPASCIATALEYFPEIGGLVYVDCAGQTIQVLYDGASEWEQLPGTYPMGGLHDYAVYNPVLGQVLFGLGNDSLALHLLDGNGDVTTIAEPPRGFHPSPDDPETFRILTVDPISGRFIAVSPSGDVYDYDAGSDAWAATGSAPENLQIAIPVTTYGVVLFVSLEPAMYVYRHAAP
ncbi:MAG TPA: hypothetical protein VG755_06745 [Nannocystaceae bacterium]|nr:hypothetical protein [Nannocystaceae bacterium]